MLPLRIIFITDFFYVFTVSYRDVFFGNDFANPTGIDKNLVAFSFVHNFGVAGNDFLRLLFFASAASDLAIFSRSSSGKPSSIIMEQEIYIGFAPETARSLTVPATASFPISPPGKKNGIHHEGISSKRKVFGLNGKDATVALLIEDVVAEMFDKNFFDQIMGHLTATAMTE